MRMGNTVRVAVVNGSSDSPVLGKDLELMVVPPRGAEVLADGPVAWENGSAPVSAFRAQRAVFTRALLRPGRRWEVCGVRNARGRVRATVRWQDADGRWREVTAREADTQSVKSADRRAEGLP
jgi:hypothetical protein